MSLLSRTPAKLAAAAEELKGLRTGCVVHTVAGDVTDFAQARRLCRKALCARQRKAALEVILVVVQVCEALAVLQSDNGCIDLLICCAGTSVPGKAFLDLVCAVTLLCPCGGVLITNAEALAVMQLAAPCIGLWTASAAVLALQGCSWTRMWACFAERWTSITRGRCIQ